MNRIGRGPMKIFEWDGVSFWRRLPDQSLMFVDLDEIQTLVDGARQTEKNLMLMYGRSYGSEDEDQELPLAKADPPGPPPEEEVEHPTFNTAKYYAVERSTGKKP